MSMKGKLLNDIYSVLKGKEPYGQRGAQVTVVFEHGEVLIVEGTRQVYDDKVKKWLKVGTHRYAINKKDLNIQS
jgi:hypothetical protein